MGGGRVGSAIVRDLAADDGFAVLGVDLDPVRVERMTEFGAEGMVADLVVFSGDFRDNATFTEPHQLSSGVVHLFVNGEAAILDGEFTGARSGRVLTRGKVSAVAPAGSRRQRITP